MKRWLKILVWFLAINLVLLSSFIATVVYYVDPNQFKAPVQQTILAHTGHQLKLEGPMRWKWYPMLSLEIQKLSLDNQAPFSGVLMSADKLKVGLGLWPLLRGRIVCDFDLEGATLVLERDDKGQGNWEKLQKALASAPPKSAQEMTSNTKPESYRPPIALNNLRIQNAQLVYHDSKKNQHYMLNHLDLNARGLIQGLFKDSNPLSLAFQVDQLNKKPLGSVALQAQWSLLDFSQLKLSDLTLRLISAANQPIDLKGELQISNSTAFNLSGHLKSDAFKLSSLLLQEGDLARHPLLHSPLELETSFEYQDTILRLNPLTLKNQDGLSLEGTLTADFSANAFLNKLMLKANLVGDHLNVGSIPLEALKAQIQANNGVFTIAPLDFRLGGAQQHLELGLRLDSAQPQWSLQQSGESFELKTVLAAFVPNNPIEGKATLDMQLSAQGMPLENLEKTLSGKINLQIAEGKINHIDLVTLIKKALSGIHDLLAPFSGQPNATLDTSKTDATLATESKTWMVNPLDTKAFTPFNSLKASMTLTKGIANNPNLQITHKDYTITGSGNLDLVHRQLDYKASALLSTNPYPATDEIGAFLFQSPLPIQIQGSMDAPSIKPDLNTYLNNAFKYLQKNKVEQLIHKTIDKTLGHFLKLKQQNE